MIEKLSTIAKKVREGIICAIEDEQHVGQDLSSFPHGSCEIASTILGLHLKELGFDDVVLSIGRRLKPNDINYENHVWLKINRRFIVDITADQFDDCDNEVIVTKESEFHCFFEVYETRQVSESLLHPTGTKGYLEVCSKALDFACNT